MSDTVTTDTAQHVHVHSAYCEPATRFNVGAPLGETRWWGFKPHRLLRPWCCGQPKRRRKNGKRYTVPGRLRLAKNCVVQVYYDTLPIWCAPGKGCRKEPKA